MLVVVSDMHLGDGSTAGSVPSSAFRLFSHRLGETAYYASFRRDGRYRPIESIDLLFMGDILDPLHSTLWLKTMPGDPDYVRPWSDPSNPNFSPKLREVTQAILEENKKSMQVLRDWTAGWL